MTSILMGALIAFLPLFLSISGNLDTNRGSKEFMLLYSLIFMLMFMGSRRRRIPKYYLTAVLFFIIMGFLNMHYFFSSNVISHYINILVGGVFFVRFYETFNSKYKQYIFDGMVIGALIQSVIGIAGYNGLELYAYFLDAVLPLKIVVSSTGDGKNNVVGSLGNIGLMGCYLALCLPAFMSRSAYKYLVALPVVALMLTETYMGILAGVGVAAYLINEQDKFLSKKEIYLYTILLMIAGPIGIPEAFNGRLEPWAFIFKNASIKHWLIGMGPGWFPDQKMLVVGVGYFIQEHSLFITLFNAYGLLGFLVLAPIFWKFINSKDKNPLFASTLFAGFISSYGHFVPQQATAMAILIPILAICLDLD